MAESFLTGDAHKLALIGAGGVGKSTLFEVLEAIYMDVPGTAFVEEAAARYFAKYPTESFEERMSRRVKMHIQSWVMQGESEAHRSGAKLIICDRSVVDAPAYLTAAGDVDGARTLMNRVSHWISTYDNLFLLDPEDVPFEQTEIRQEDEATRTELHKSFISLLQQYDIGYTLLSGTLEERLDSVLSTIPTHLDGQPL